MSIAVGLLVFLLGLMIPSETAKIVPSTEYVTYIPGNINLIISSPHEGSMKPSDIPDRKPGCKINGKCNFRRSRSSCKNICKIGQNNDLHTQVIARSVVNHFRQQTTGKTPHLIINNLHRSKLDANRPIEEAAQGDRRAASAYKDYHDTIEKVRSTFKGPGLLIDLHGQSHKKNSTELGYLWKPEELNEGDFTRIPSVKSLMERKGYTTEDILFGQASLGYLFEKAGYKALPSPRQKAPGKDPYYRGGWTIQRWGSSWDCASQIDALQIEVPAEIRFEGGSGLTDRFSASLANILNTFFNNNY